MAAHDTAFPSRRLPALPLLALVVSLGACDCGDDNSPGVVRANPDAGSRNDGGADGPPDPVTPGDGMLDDPDREPRNPPEGLEDEACAVDVDKLYELANSDGIVGDTKLAVDLFESEFAMVYVDTSDECQDAVQIARFSGPTGSPPPAVSIALDPCAEIGRTALSHNGEKWLIATVDNREGPKDVWIQSLGNVDGAHRLSQTPGEELDVAVMAAPPLVSTDTVEVRSQIGKDGFAAVAWVDQDVLAGTHALLVQLLDVDGAPMGEPQVLYDHGELEFTSLSLARIGEDKLGVGYRRFNRSGLSEIVFEVRDALTGELERPPWVLTTDGGRQGTIELATDELGGGIAYSIEQGTEGRQVWFIRLDAKGEAAPVIVAGNLGGPSEPKRIVGLPYKGVDASIAKLLRGYAVAYRALPGGPGIDEAQIRVQILNSRGEIEGDSNSAVAYAAEQGGRTTIAAAYDGRISIGWTDATEDLTGTTVHVVRLPCVR